MNYDKMSLFIRCYDTRLASFSMFRCWSLQRALGTRESDVFIAFSCTKKGRLASNKKHAASAGES